MRSSPERILISKEGAEANKRRREDPLREAAINALDDYGAKYGPDEARGLASVYARTPIPRLQLVRSAPASLSADQHFPDLERWRR